MEDVGVAVNKGSPVAIVVEQYPPATGVDDTSSTSSAIGDLSQELSLPTVTVLDTSRNSLISNVSSQLEHRRSVVHPQEQNGLSRFFCTAIVVNYICVGYIFLPYGKFVL